ncbi:MAG: hypothetical protein LM593_00675 [Candidatus Verstraetearchaeota archaeon]|jgi:dolichol kinase|nr:hypothetical protein [Candidatus Verstraetearchaeota archaeon]
MQKAIKKELVRKTFHILGVLVPIIYVLFGKDLTIFYLSILLLIFIFLEFIRIRAPILFPLNRISGEIIRSFEKTALASYIYFCVAALIIVFFFSRNSIIIGITSALIGDAISAISGIALGKHRIKNKTIEGSFLGMITVTFISYILLNLLLSIHVITTPILLGISFFIFDIVDFKFDDNFILPLGMSLVYNLLEVTL